MGRRRGSYRGLALLLLLGPAGCPRVETPAPPTSTVRSDPWRALLRVAELPDITDAARLDQAPNSPCIGGWRVDTPRGSMIILDNLTVQWGGTWYEDWPADQRVEPERYEGRARPPFVRGPDEPRRMPLRRGDAPSWEETSAERHFDRLLASAEPSTDDPSESINRCMGVLDRLGSAGEALVRASQIHWAETRGRAEVARRLQELHEAVLADIGVLRNQMARWLLEQAKWGLVHGMPRAEVTAYGRRAQGLAPGDPELGAEIDQLLATVGSDPPSLPATPTATDLIAHLPDELVFPEPRWEPPFEDPTWLATQQPFSPAWALVDLGWPVLPTLREAMGAPQVLRRADLRVTEDRQVRIVLPHTAGDLARSVAAAITGRHFADVAQFDAWWQQVGIHGPLAARRDAVLNPENTDLHRHVRALLLDDDADPWATLGAAMALDRDFERIFEVKTSVEDLLVPWTDEDEDEDEDESELEDDGQNMLPEPARSRHLPPFRRALRRLLDHPDLDVRIDAAATLSRVDEPRWAVAMTRHVVKQLEQTKAPVPDDWVALVEAVIERHPALALRLLRAVGRTEDPSTLSDVQDYVEAQCEAEPPMCPQLEDALL